MGSSCSDLKENSANPCRIMGCVKNVIGLAANSASPTDTWTVNFKPNTKYEKDLIKSGFMKIWITADDAPDPKYNPGGVKSIRGLEYEKRVYLEVIKKLIDARVCPNFSRALGGGTKCSMENLTKGTDGAVLVDQQSFLRNMTYAYTDTPHRPSINNTDPASEELKEIMKYDDITYEQISDKRFDFIISETADGLVLDTYLNSGVHGHVKDSMEFWHIVYQNFMALYVLGLVKITHNDNHTGNVFIDNRAPSDMHYMVQRSTGLSVFTLPNVNKIAKIYDWDRTYSHKIGTNELIKFMDVRNSSDTFVSAKDLLKFVCHLVHLPENIVSPRSKLVLVGCLMKGTMDEKSQMVANLLKDKNCWFEEYGRDSPNRNIDNDPRIRPFGQSLKLLEDYLISIKLATRTDNPPEDLSNAWYVDARSLRSGFLKGDNPFPVATAALIEARDESIGALSALYNYGAAAAGGFGSAYRWIMGYNLPVEQEAEPGIFDIPYEYDIQPVALRTRAALQRMEEKEIAERKQASILAKRKFEYRRGLGESMGTMNLGL
jgi:hypothetical protein